MIEVMADKSLWMALAFAFAIGSFPSAYLLVRMCKGHDIRKMGSGNVGATNVFRHAGKRLGSCVLLIDMAKGFIAVTYITPFGTGWNGDPKSLELIIGIAAILGHVFTPFLRGKGGKGVATGAGVGFAAFPACMITALLVWALLLKLTRYMSLASILASYAFAVSAAALLSNPFHILLAFLLALFITWTHRSNIQRLVKGTESHFLSK